MKCFMGIDAGTSGIKAVILDETGRIVGSGYHECDIIPPRPGWVEQTPEVWWQACSAAAKQAAASSGCGMQVAGIGFSGQMQGCQLLDRDYQPIGNCIIWLDQRSSREVEEIEQLIPDEESIGITANHCLNSFWAPKLLWLRKNRPQDYERAAKVVFAKDYIRYRMTGELAADVSDASLSFLMDVPGRCWSKTMFSRLGIDISLAPERLAGSADVVGTLLPAVAEDWGVPAGIPVVAGGGDQPAGGVGTGIVRPGILGATIGTSGVVFGCTAEPMVDTEKRAIMTMAHSEPNTWCFLGLVLSAGGAFKWLRDTVFTHEKAACAASGQEVYDCMTALAAQARPGCEGLVFLPYLNGEKTPISDENARGVFFGLSLRHGLPEITRSVMEGVTFAMRDTVEICRELGMSVDEIRANGGGAKSPLWLQMQADIYKTSVVTTNIDEGPAAGGAIMAAVGAGYFSGVTEGCDSWLKISHRVDPDPEVCKIYDDCYQSYKDLYPALKERFASQAALLEKHMS